MTPAETGGPRAGGRPAEPAPRRRGRPRQGADPQGPLDEWLDALPPTAVRITEVGRTLLLEEGYEAVTIERVALEAGVDPATVRRHFLSKAGLVHAIWDRLQIEPWAALVARIRELPEGERLDAYVRGLGALLTDPRIGIATAEVAAHGLRDAAVRGKLAADYEIARSSAIAATGLGGAQALSEAQTSTLISLVVAVIDGLSLQVAADREALDVDAAFALLAEMVRSVTREGGGVTNDAGAATE